MRSRIAAVLAFTTGLTQSASKNFVPDVTFKGGDLSGWRSLGDAKWRAENGEIIATPNGGSGWLILEKSYQDVAFFSEFRCAPGCTMGLLFRAEKTADGGLKGIFVSLNAADAASYHVTLDAQGKETSRERLRPAGGGQVRVAPPAAKRPADAVQPGVVRRPRRAGRGGGGPAFPQMPGGMAEPIPRPSNEMKAGEWNTIDIVLDANILRPFLNDAGGVSGGVADEEFGRSGAIALVRRRNRRSALQGRVLNKDLQPRVALPEEVSSRFRMQALNEFYYSWGPDVADINRDGVPDIVAGPYYYLGPDYNVARGISTWPLRSTRAPGTSTAYSSPTTSLATAGRT